MMDSATSPSAPRRMTALVEISENQMKIKGRFCPVLMDQTLITLLCPSRIKGVWVMLSHISYHLLRRVTGVAHGSNFNS